MAQLTEANVALRWLEGCGRIDPIYPTEVGRNLRGFRTYETWAIKIDEDGHLNYLPRWDRKPSTELGRFVGERRLRQEGGGGLLLNGDGFESQIMQGVQTRVRERARRKFANKGVMIIPYMALTGAQIEYESILPIHCSGDTWIEQRVAVELPPAKEIPRVQQNQGQEEVIWNGQRWAVRNNWGRRIIHLMYQPMNGAARWHEVHGKKDAHFIRERIHNLGSTVFSAVGPDGDRHRYLSAFDTQERTPMYFLAQLPDEAEVTDYQTAVHALAPPIVHQARAEGRRVHRQGDIFAIQTDLTDLWFSTDPGCKITARHEVFQANSETRLNPLTKKRKRKDLMIYGTGHTATLVVVRENGSTFIKGTMTHDPVLERAGRAREHANVSLDPFGSWFLCVRNTVPRATPKREEETNGSSRKGESGSLRVRRSQG